MRQEKVQDIFIRLVFGKKHAPHSSGTNNADSISLYSDVAGQGIFQLSNLAHQFEFLIFFFFFIFFIR